MVRSSQLVTSQLSSSVRSGKVGRLELELLPVCAYFPLIALTLRPSLCRQCRLRAPLRLVHLVFFSILRSAVLSLLGPGIIANLFAFPPFVFIGTFARKLVNSTLPVHISLQCVTLTVPSFSLRRSLGRSLGLLCSLARICIRSVKVRRLFVAGHCFSLSLSPSFHCL